MLEIKRTIIACVVLSGISLAQPVTHPKFFDRARIQHLDSGVRVTANAPIPLFQAIEAVRLEYGWQINWESAPCYSHFDVVDDTDQKWRAEHPAAKGVTRPSGGLFTGTFPEPKDSSGPESEISVLTTLVNEYNATDNPGKYAITVDPNRQVTVVGTTVRDETGVLREIHPLLDTPVTLAAAPRPVYDTIKSIIGALQAVTGKKVLFAAASSSLFRMTQGTTGGEHVPARELLKQALASTKESIQYDLSFDPDVPVYILSVSPAMREDTDKLGARKLTPLNR